MIAKKFPEAAIAAAENGRAGLELFKKRAADIVITDVNMPEMDGIDMAAAIKSTKADTKFIVLTAYNEKRFFEKFSEIGFSAYLLKPIEFKKLFAAIEKCLEDISAQKK
jgi:YesN/AraC family two-component response regulator